MATKFIEGAWLIVVAIPVLVYAFLAVQRHYQRVAAALRTGDLSINDLSPVADVVIVAMADVHRGTLRALRYARRIATDVRAVCITTSPEMKERLIRRWDRFADITRDIKLICIDYDYRDILTPLVDYILHVNHVEFPDHLTTVVIPEFIAEEGWEQLLHNQTANSLRRALHRHEDIVVIDLPFHIRSAKDWRREFQAEPGEGSSHEAPAPDAGD